MGFFSKQKKRVAACQRPCGLSGFMTNQPCACHYSKKQSGSCLHASGHPTGFYIKSLSSILIPHRLPRGRSYVPLTEPTDHPQVSY